MKKTSADLGNRNIPKNLVQEVVGSQLKALWFRDETENKTIEIWTIDTDEYAVVVGQNDEEEWRSDLVSFFGKFPSISSATAEIKANFTLKSFEEPEIQASSTFKRLIKKSGK